jgi:N-acetylglucosamine PTS system EIICBA or EIICB component
LLSMALTSFLTGVTEPIEFAFMFLAPALYIIHAVLTGIAMVLMHALGVHLGFGFSAGLFDYVLNYSLATRPLLLIPVGLAYFAVYYGLFRYVIVRFDLKTLGREAEGAAVAAAAGSGSSAALEWIRALGQAANLRAVEACTTRLRLVLNDPNLIDEAALTSLGSRGVLRIGDGAVQVVVGPIADQLASEIRASWRALPAVSAPAPVRAQASAAPPTSISDRSKVQAMLAALGGRGNITGLHANSTRLCVSVRDPSAVNEAALGPLTRAFARPAPSSVHLIVGPEARAWAAALETPAQ